MGLLAAILASLGLGGLFDFGPGGKVRAPDPEAERPDTEDAKTPPWWHNCP